jgi:hypothetical protein
MRHLSLLSAAILTIGSLHPATAFAQSDLTPELFQLCRTSPQNSRCKGFSTPLSLKDRPGESLDNCAFTFPILPAKPRNGECKYELTDNGLILYFEQGESLALLDDRRPTIELRLLPSQMFTLQQYNGFRRGGLLSGRERQMAELGFQSVPPLPSGNQTTAKEPFAIN